MAVQSDVSFDTTTFSRLRRRNPCGAQDVLCRARDCVFYESPVQTLRGSRVSPGVMQGDQVLERDHKTFTEKCNISVAHSVSRFVCTTPCYKTLYSTKEF